MNASEMQAQSAIGGVSPGACWGNWDIKDSHCQNCVIAQPYCESATRRRTEGGPPEPLDEGDSQPKVEPLEYLLTTLRGRFDEEKQENDKAVAHRFKKEGVVVMLVAIAKSGRVQLKSRNGQKIVDRFQSVDEVEEVLRALLP